MASRFAWSAGVRAARGLVRRPTLRRGAHQQSGITSTTTNTWLIGAAAGATLIAAYKVYSANRPPKPLVEQKKEAYAKAGTVHPEAVAEEQLTPQASSPTPPATPETPAEPVSPPIPLPDKVPYILVGGGTASFTAAKAIREKEPTAKILIVTEEKHSPYSRPPLSKHLWASDDHEAARQLKFTAPWSGGKLVDVYYNAEFCSPGELMEREDGGIALLTGTKVVALDTKNCTISLDGGHVITFDKCLLATGGQPKTLPLFDKAPDTVKKHVSVYRKIPDFLSLDQLLEKKKAVLVVGGGFLGTELAVGMATRYKRSGLKVYQLFPEAGNLGLVLPPALAAWTLDKVKKGQQGAPNDHYTAILHTHTQEEGVDVFANITPTAVEAEGNGVKITTSSGIELSVDHVVVAVGLQPNTQLAESASLETDPLLGGFRVNSELQACTNVWAAGDVSCFYDPHLGRRRVEHHDHAQVSGKLAGCNMAGDRQTFSHQSMFWSDVGPDVGFEAVGLVDSQLPTCGVYPKTKTDGEEGGVAVDDYSKGVVFYLSEDERKVVGVLTWNLFGKMDIARKIIAEGRSEKEIGEVVGQFGLEPKPQAQLLLQS